MPEHSINSEFADMGFLVSELRADRMTERVEGHIFRNTNTLFMF